ncbi:MAG: hypothetical protein GF355_03785 [Candidatus Eisenbacteria bacterium]|nr:hypothetical protein [Candidatus Eisenbacteria bacterium]
MMSRAGDGGPMRRPTGPAAVFAGYSYHGFISYCSADVQLVATLAKDLQDKGLHIWWDRDTGEHDRAWRAPDDERGAPLGTDANQIRAKLEQVLSTSTILIVVATQAAVASSWVQVEFAFALEGGAPIVVWHADGDFQQAKASEVPLHELSSEQARALIGERPFDQVISHISNDRRSVHAVADAINYYICFAEYLEWKNEEIGSAAMDRHEGDFDAMWAGIPALLDRIEKEHNRRLRVRRTPAGQILPNRRATGAEPWIVRAHTHLERILSDEDYRLDVFGTLTGGKSHQAPAFRRMVASPPQQGRDITPRRRPGLMRRLLKWLFPR